MQQLRHILAISLILSALGGCDLAPRTEGQPPDGSATPAAPSGAKQQLTATFEAMFVRAEAALENDDPIVATQLVARGLKETREAGRDYELSRASFLLLKGILEHNSGRTNEARRFLGDAMAVYRIHNNPTGICRVNMALATLEESTGDFAAAKRHMDAAAAALPRVTSQKLHGQFLMIEGNLLVSQMKHKDAASKYLEATKLYAGIKDKKMQAHAYLRLAAAEEAQGEMRQCENSLKKAHKIFASTEDNSGAVKALHQLATLAVRAENYKKARQLFKQVEQLYVALDRQSDATKVSQYVSALPD